LKRDSGWNTRSATCLPLQCSLENGRIRSRRQQRQSGENLERSHDALLLPSWAPRGSPKKLLQGASVARFFLGSECNVVRSC
jgi:hypothetical protein